MNETSAMRDKLRRANNASSAESPNFGASTNSLDFASMGTTVSTDSASSLGLNRPPPEEITYFYEASSLIDDNLKGLVEGLFKEKMKDVRNRLRVPGGVDLNAMEAILEELARVKAETDKRRAQME